MVNGFLALKIDYRYAYRYTVLQYCRFNEHGDGNKECSNGRIPCSIAGWGGGHASESMSYRIGKTGARLSIEGLLQGRGALQDIDQMVLFRPLCKFTATISKVRDIIPTIRQALKAAQSVTPGR